MLRTRSHLATVRTRGQHLVMETMFFEDELVGEDEVPTGAAEVEVTDRELQLARRGPAQGVAPLQGHRVLVGDPQAAQERDHPGHRHAGPLFDDRQAETEQGAEFSIEPVGAVGPVDAATDCGPALSSRPRFSCVRR